MAAATSRLPEELAVPMSPKRACSLDAVAVRERIAAGRNHFLYFAAGRHPLQRGPAVGMSYAFPAAAAEALSSVRPPIYRLARQTFPARRL